MNNIENIQEYIPTVYVNDSEPDLDETNLNKTEQAIKRVTDAANKAIDALKQLDREKLALSAISNVLSDATDKVPSLALANTMQLAINDLNSNLANGYPSSICVKDELKNSLIKIQGFSDGNAGISLNKADGTIHRLLFNSDGRLRYGKYNNTWSISDILTNLEVQRGSTPGISCAANAITESTITFPNAFKSAPKVVVGFYSDTKLAAYGMMTPMVCNVTTTNFKVRIANASNTALTPAIYWIARE